MNKKPQLYSEFIKAICESYGCSDAIRPLQEGFAALCEAFPLAETNADKYKKQVMDNMTNPADKPLRTYDTKRKWINKFYTQAKDLTGHLYKDDNWAGVYEFFDTMRQRMPELGIQYWVVDGGYSHPGDDGMPRRKTYNIGIKTPEGVDIAGMLHCDAAGTVENPFGAYDMTLILN